jgi:hypothetical protein
MKKHSRLAEVDAKVVFKMEYLTLSNTHRKEVANDTHAKLRNVFKGK